MTADVAMNGAVVEEVVSFECAKARLWGILARPAADGAATATAVLIVTGGPQYRVGSHRQFVSLARSLAVAGFPALRFDCTGMGDSEGELRPFDRTGPDLRSALDALSRACPQSRRIAVWGLCDAASAALMFATDDPRVAGIVAANPWARSEGSLAAVTMKHYYTARLLQREFWGKLLRGGIGWGDSLRSLRSNLKRARLQRRTQGAGADEASFRTAMARGLSRFEERGGRMLLILSGNDLTAREFVAHAESAPAWKGLLDDRKVSRLALAEADHTFSRRSWLEAAEAGTIAWLRSLGDASALAASLQIPRGSP